MSNKNEPSNPKRFVAGPGDIEVIKGPLRIRGELPPIHGARPSTSSPAHPLPPRQKPPHGLSTDKSGPDFCCHPSRQPGRGRRRTVSRLTGNRAKPQPSSAGAFCIRAKHRHTALMSDDLPMPRTTQRAGFAIRVWCNAGCRHQVDVDPGSGASRRSDVFTLNGGVCGSR
jgi:hypothetical protein